MKFPPFDTVRLVVFGLANVEGHVLVVEKGLLYTWKQTSESVAEM